jgi:hypothetical protein
MLAGTAAGMCVRPPPGPCPDAADAHPGPFPNKCSKQNTNANDVAILELKKHLADFREQVLSLEHRIEMDGAAWGCIQTSSAGIGKGPRGGGGDARPRASGKGPGRAAAGTCVRSGEALLRASGKGRPEVDNGTPLQSATGRVCPAPLCAGSAQTPGSHRLRAPSGNRCPFPGGFGVRPATTVSLRAALAARQPVRLDARQLPSASGRLGHASRCCPATLPRGGLGVRTLWPGGGRRLPDAHRPFNLPYL